MYSNLLLYGVASIFYLMVGIKIVLSFKKRTDTAPVWALPVIGVGIATHYWILQAAAFPGNGAIQMSFGISISAMCFFSALILFFGAVYSRVHTLFALVLLVASVGVWAPVIWPAQAPPILEATSAFRLHIVMGLVAYSFMMMAVIQAVLMTIMDLRLKNHAMLDEPEGLVATMPNLMKMEKILFSMVTMAFVFLTFTIAGGMFSTAHYFDTILNFDHKTTLTILAWLAFGTLLVGRRVFGWRSRKAMTVFWIAVALQVLAYFVYRFVLEMLL